MHNKGHFPNVFFGARQRLGGAAFYILMLLLLLIFVWWFFALTAPPAQAQTYKVIYNFTGEGDGAWPNAGLTIDWGSNSYETTAVAFNESLFPRHGHAIDA
jgi:hypothetical protein